MKFTDSSLKALTLKAGQKDRIVFDDDPRQLGLRLTASGRMFFLVQKHDADTGKKVREPIGEYGEGLTIKDARKVARRIIGRIAGGEDLQATKVAKREAERVARAAEKAAKSEQALTLDVLIDTWGTRHLSQKRERYAAEAQRALRYAFAKHLKEPAVALTRAVIMRALDKLAGSGKGTTADRTKAYGRACYGWAVGREKVASNPFEGLPSFSEDRDRDRVLTDGEIVEIAAAATAMPYPWGPYYKLALLTPQRRDEVAGMRWSELSADRTLWTIPGERMKNGKPHDVHLSAPARTILDAIPRVVRRDLVFSTTGKTPVSGFSRAKANLDAAVVAERKKEAAEQGREPAPLVPWRLHDFRRTGVSTMAALGIDSIVADKILAHKPAKLKGVAAVYQRHEFAKERQMALEAWAAHVASIGQDRGNVVPMRRT